VSRSYCVCDSFESVAENASSILSDAPNSRAYVHSQFAGRGSMLHADWPDDRSWWPLKGPFQALT
jgi:hypothetical protein